MFNLSFMMPLFSLHPFMPLIGRSFELGKRKLLPARFDHGERRSITTPTSDLVLNKDLITVT